MQGGPFLNCRNRMCGTAAQGNAPEPRPMHAPASIACITGSSKEWPCPTPTGQG